MGEKYNEPADETGPTQGEGSGAGAGSGPPPPPGPQEQPPQPPPEPEVPPEVPPEPLPEPPEDAFNPPSKPRQRIVDPRPVGFAPGLMDEGVEIRPPIKIESTIPGTRPERVPAPAGWSHGRDKDDWLQSPDGKRAIWDWIHDRWVDAGTQEPMPPEWGSGYQPPQ